MFGEKLKSAVGSVDGGLAAIIMGFDGISVDSHNCCEFDIETVGMEFSVVLKEVRKASEMLEAGDASELTVRSSKFSTVLRTINDEYFVALTLGTAGNIGKARYVLRILAPELSEELV